MHRLPALLAVMALLLFSVGARLSGQQKSAIDVTDYNGAMKALQSTSSADRAAGLSYLAAFGEKGKTASREVVGALFDASPDVRKWAVTALQKVNPDLSGPVLALVQGQNPEARSDALGKLAKLGEGAAAAVPALLAFLKDASPADRVSAVKTLSAVGAKDAKLAEVLATVALRDADPAVRAEALKALPKQQNMAGAIDYLNRVASNADGTARERIAALGVLADAGKGNPQALKVFEDIMRTSTSQEVRAAAKQALDKAKKK
jgi:HEAT repeat protein